MHMTRKEFLARLARSLAVGSLALVAGLAAAQSPPAQKAKSLKIVLVGASGMIGSRVLAEASSRGHEVTAAARRPERIATGPGITPVKLDASDAAALTALAKDADVIVLATSPRSGGDPVQEAKAVGDAAIAAAKATGKRLFVVGGAGSLKRADGTSVLDSLPAALQRGEPGALRNVLASLKASDINWTFFSPALSIRPGEKTGKYRLGSDTLITDADGNSRISAEDYAHALVNELENPKYERSQMTIAY
jgi:putative NADH-flavin reductase